MSIITDFLNLFKYDPETDGDNTFNIKQCLNDNWDKIDAWASGIKTTIAGLVPGTRKINNKELSADVTLTAMDIGAVDSDTVGQPGGVATLDSSGKVPSGQLPAMDYVPDSEKGAANGVATLDGNGKLTASQKPTYTAGEVGAATTAYVDTKVSSEAGTRSSADTNLQNQINSLSNTSAQFYYGSYTGDATKLRFISLGFAPKAVICARYDGQILTGNRILGGIVFPAATTTTNKSGMGIYIEGNGFYVQYTSDEFWNNSYGSTYYYIAVK